MQMLPRGGKPPRAQGAHMTSSPSTAGRSKSPKAPAAKGVVKSFTITELAAEFDVTPRAIRFYEDVGLLEPQRAGRNRVYSQRERTRLKLTLRGKRLGLSLQEIKQLVDMYDSPSDTAPQLEAFLAVLRSHRKQIELQLEDIRVTLEEIDQHEARCERLLEAATATAGARGLNGASGGGSPGAPAPAAKRASRA
jgi:DNA-binding transcriptional MerR regulator